MTEEFTVNYERVLIVDDEEITRMMLRRVLEQTNYRNKQVLGAC